MATLSNSKRIKFGRYYVEVYIQHHEKLYNLLIGAVIETVCHLYFDETESFSQIPKEKEKKSRLKLNNTNLMVELTSKGASTAYGNIFITKRLDIISYKWTFNIKYLRWTMLIGIDSNPKFRNTDFSNFYRNFTTKHNDTFCGYSSDGNLYHNNNRHCDQYGIEYKTGDIIQMVINLRKETLGFIVNGQHQGIALTKLDLVHNSYKMAVALFHPDDCIEITDFEVEWNEAYMNDSISSDDEDETSLDINTLPKLDGTLVVKPYQRMYVMIRGPFVCIREVNDVVGYITDFDESECLIILECKASKDREFRILTQSKLGGNDKQFEFECKSKNERDEWVKNIQSYIELYH